jgi:hypothetical protein
MNTARIVVLTIAVGAGSVAACHANGPDNNPLPTGPVAQLQTANVAEQLEMPTRPTGPLSQTVGSMAPKGGAR